jgi:hypothetical protein
VTRASRDKGARIEREIAARHVALGVTAERVPLSDVAHHRGNGSDIDVYAFGPDRVPLVGEIKPRGNGEGFALLERWLAMPACCFCGATAASRWLSCRRGFGRGCELCLVWFRPQENRFPRRKRGIPRSGAAPAGAAILTPAENSSPGWLRGSRWSVLTITAWAASHALL